MSALRYHLGIPCCRLCVAKDPTNFRITSLKLHFYHSIVRTAKATINIFNTKMFTSKQNSSILSIFKDWD